MAVVQRIYRGEADLIEMQRIVALRTMEMGSGTNLHPGDIAHRIHSGLRNDDLAEVVPVWQDAVGIAAFGIVWSKDDAFDFVARIGIDRVDYAEALGQLISMSENNGRVETEVIGVDPALVDALITFGFEKMDTSYSLTERKLRSPAEIPDVPFTLRSASMPDVVQLAAVHSGAFGSRWTPESYLHRMQQPGYSPDNEVIAVADDGTFAGFTNTWYDDLNGVGYFEPVGVHRDFHRMGVGSALLWKGMERMRAAGMATASVWHSVTDARATAFYRANGFEELNPVTPWVRTRR